MDIFVSGFAKEVDLGGGNVVVLKKLPYSEVTEQSDASRDDGTGKTVYKAVCAHIADWRGPELDGKPLDESVFSQLSPEFFDALIPHVMKIRGLTTEEGKGSTETSNSK